METAKIGLKTFLYAIAVILVIEGIGGYSLSGIAISNLLKIGILRIVETIALLSLILMMENGFISVGLSRSRFSIGIKKGFVYSFSFGMSSIAIGIIIWIAGVNPLLFFQTSSIDDNILFFQLLLVGGFIAPLTEELFFRGIIFSYFRQWGLCLAILISTFFFVSLHITNGIPVTQTIGGIVFAISYEKSRSLLTPVIIHVMGNLSLFSLSTLVMSIQS